MNETVTSRTYHVRGSYIRPSMSVPRACPRRGAGFGSGLPPASPRTTGEASSSSSPGRDPSPSSAHISYISLRIPSIPHVRPLPLPLNHPSACRDPRTVRTLRSRTFKPPSLTSVRPACVASRLLACLVTGAGTTEGVVRGPGPEGVVERRERSRRGSYSDEFGSGWVPTMIFSRC